MQDQLDNIPEAPKFPKIGVIARMDEGARSVEELDADISAVAPAQRWYCESKMCGCMGCVNSGLVNARKTPVTKAEFYKWAEAYPEKVHVPEPVDADALNAAFKKLFERNAE